MLTSGVSTLWRSWKAESGTRSTRTKRRDDGKPGIPSSKEMTFSSGTSAGASVGGRAALTGTSDTCRTHEVQQGGLEHLAQGSEGRLVRHLLCLKIHGRLGQVYVLDLRELRLDRQGVARVEREGLGDPVACGADLGQTLVDPPQRGVDVGDRLGHRRGVAGGDLVRQVVEHAEDV